MVGASSPPSSSTGCACASFAPRTFTRWNRAAGPVWTILRSSLSSSAEGSPESFHASTWDTCTTPLVSSRAVTPVTTSPPPLAPTALFSPPKLSFVMPPFSAVSLSFFFCSASRAFSSSVRRSHGSSSSIPYVSPIVLPRNAISSTEGSHCSFEFGSWPLRAGWRLGRKAELVLSKARSMACWRERAWFRPTISTPCRAAKRARAGESGNSSTRGGRSKPEKSSP